RHPRRQSLHQPGRHHRAHLLEGQHDGVEPVPAGAGGSLGARRKGKQAMSVYVSTAQIGMQRIDQTDTTQNHPLGTTVRGVDSVNGEGEFIYLLGVASTVVGSLVKWNATTFQTALVANTANQAVPVAVAMSANVAGQYGWYQIGGNAVLKKTAVTVAP